MTGNEDRDFRKKGKGKIMKLKKRLIVRLGKLNGLDEIKDMVQNGSIYASRELLNAGVAR